MAYDYYYGNESERFAFYRIPRSLIKSEEFKSLSSDSKILYGLMLDRMSLSRSNNWIDDKNRVYIIYTIDDIMDDLNCSKHSAVKYAKELQNFGLITKKIRGQGLPALIYVMDFISNSNNDKSNDSENQNKDIYGVENSEVQKMHSLKCKNSNSKSAKNETLVVQDLHPNHIDIKNTDTNNHSIIQDNEINIQRLPNEANDFFEKFKKRVGYAQIAKEGNQDIADVVLSVIDELNKSSSRLMMISGVSYRLDDIRQKAATLDEDSFKHIINGIRNTGQKIKNYKKYVIAAIINSKSATVIDGAVAGTPRSDFEKVFEEQLKMRKEHESDKEKESPEVVKINEELTELRMKLLTCQKEEGERIKEKIKELLQKKHKLTEKQDSSVVDYKWLFDNLNIM